MFGTPFYFSTLRKYVILVGTLFNNIRITKTDASGNQVSLIKVPITYAPKDKMLARVLQDPNIDRETATIPLPVISFEMGKMTYDGTRKLNTIGRIAAKDSTNPSKSKYQYNPVPYNIEFKVYIYAKNAEDGTKIIEQVLPYFTPDWTTTVNLIPEMNVNMDIPVILNNINYSDNYDGQFVNRRAIIWSLDLVLKGYVYGPVKKSNIIKFVTTNLYTPSVPDGSLATAIANTPVAERVTIQPGLNANAEPITYFGQANDSLGTLAYTAIESDDNYGFITFVYNTDEIE
jgi:hypothetical protein